MPIHDWTRVPPGLFHHFHQDWSIEIARALNRGRLPEGQDRILVSYQTNGQRVAYIEPVGIGSELPEMPLFLHRDLHVMVPLESTYCATWSAGPEELKTAVQTGSVPEPDVDE